VYKKLIKPGGLIHLKTDSTLLFEYSLELLSNRPDVCDLEFTRQLYGSDYEAAHHGIKTKYEIQFTELGEKIKYLKFRFQS
jgi:tRNA (guanine-N7-)-methyltransferase